MRLGEKQEIFIENVGKLIAFAYAHGYRLRGGQLLRSLSEANANAEKKVGIKNSLHLIALAIDFNLFKDGKFLTRSEDHRQLGEYWKGLHPLNRWGGDFKSRPDGNHYSMEHEGVQ